MSRALGRQGPRAWRHAAASQITPTPPPLLYSVAKLAQLSPDNTGAPQLETWKKSH